ncbi:MAG: rod shape-determining protein MreC, partial [Dokdonella sp.]|nr:rod shape-determining protein MreC [Dokdonella sp.]
MPLTRTDKVPLFAEGGVSTLRLIVYLTMAMIVMVVDHRAGYLEGLRQLASRVIEPVYRVAGLPAEAA